MLRRWGIKIGVEKGLREGRNTYRAESHGSKGL